MKKGFKAVTAAALAISALTPVAAFAAESTVDNGVYTTSNYYSIDAFKKLSGSAKAAALTSEGAVIVIAGKVYTGNNVITLSDSQLDASAVTVDAYNAANGNKLVSGKPIGEGTQTGDLKVESVNAINSKQIQIKFNEAVKKSSVIGTGGILENNLVVVQRTEAATTPTGVISNTATTLSTGTTAVLSEDGKTLTVTLATGVNVNGTYTVTVKGVLSATTEKAVKDFASTFSVADNVAPTVEKAEFNSSTGNFEITYSEPLDKAPTVVRVNGEVISSTTLSDNQKVVTFARPASVNIGTTASVYVANATDGVGNPSVAYTGDVVLKADASALQVASAKQQDSNTVRVVFNKSLNNASVTELTTAGTTALTVLNNGGTPGTFTVSQVTSDTTNKTFDVQFTDGTAPHYDIYGANKNTTNISLIFADGKLEDVFGQKLASNTQQVTLTKDLTAPKALSAKPSADGTKIEVTFDEEISATVTAANITLRKDGVDLTAVATATQKATSGEDAKVVVIEPAAADLVNGKVSAGTYTVRLSSGAVTDAHGNKNAAANINATVSGTSELTVDNVTTPATNQFEVEFSSAVTAATALSAANYTIDGAALPSATDIKFKGSTGADARTVVITLPDQSNNIEGKGELAVKNVKTASGLTVTPKTAEITLKDNKSPELVSASLVSSNLIKLTFNEALTTYAPADIDAILADIEIASGSNKFAKDKVGTGTTDATATGTSNGKDILITVTPGDSNWATIISSSNVTVKLLDSGTAGDGLTDTIKDVNSVAATAGTTVNLTK